MILQFSKYTTKLPGLFFYNSKRLISKRVVNSRPADTLIIEKLTEEPVLVVDENDEVDIIGPPDPLSNLRPIIRKRTVHETLLQQQLRELQDATQIWNQNFWAVHNTKFIKERQEYIDQHQIAGEEKRLLSPDEMSEFYKRFLDDNWKTHVNYNSEWYKKNFILLILAFRVNLEKILLKIR